MSAFPNLPEGIPLPATDGVTNGAPDVTPPSSFQLLDRPVDSARRMKVIVIGAGYSGIYLGIRIPEKLRNVDLVIYEKNNGVGGTWHENRYLGCACDIPSHSYQFSFSPNPNWSSLYAPAPEIRAYLESMAKKYSADRFIKLEHEVVGCTWDEQTAKWTVEVKSLRTGEVIEDQADFLISARGTLNDKKWPDIEGLAEFGGEVMHSAGWNQSYDFTNKRIGVIGSGSSSIQIVPSLQRISGTHVTTFARSKTWISPSFSQGLWEKYGFDGFDIPEELKKRFNTDPAYYQKFRLAVEEDGNNIHSVTIKGTPLQEGGKKMFTEHMKKRLESAPEIYKALLPSFSPGCRRLTPGPGYLEALTQPNVAFVTSPITKISPNTVHTSDGVTHHLDALICATGFNTATAPPFPIYGTGSLPLSAHWSHRPTTYLSHSTSRFPNLYQMLGPNAGIGSGSLTIMIEASGDYAVKMIRKMQKEDIARVEVKKEREEDFMEVVDAYFKRTVFGEECRSWYKNSRGEITGIWPGSCLHFLEAMRSPRWEDYEYRYVDEVGEEQDEGLAKVDSVVETNTVAGSGDILSTGRKGRRRRVNQLAWLGNGWTENGLASRHTAFYLYPEFQDMPVAPKPEERETESVRPFSY